MRACLRVCALFLAEITFVPDSQTGDTECYYSHFNDN